MDHEALKSKIGAAWKAHYEGENDIAIDQFSSLAEQHPENVDVLWGLGLSYRKAGDHANALKTFEKIDQLVTSFLENDPDEYERYFMLARMAKQQIKHINEFLT